MSRHRQGKEIALCTSMHVLCVVYSESSDNYDIEYLNGDAALPIFSRQSRQRTSSLHTVRSILDTSDDLICSKHPIQIDTNCTFIVDSTKLLDPDDVKCDDCGAWKQTKTATATLHIDFFENGRVSSVQVQPSVTKRRCYTLISRHYTCKSSPDLSRHISMLLDPTGQPKPNLYIQYRFSGSEHSVNAQPHGNSKKTLRPYKRTCLSTLQDLSEELKQHPPKRAIFKVDKKRGGISNISCVGDLPRNVLQATRIKNKVSSASVSKSSNSLQSLVVKFKQQHGSPDQYIQSIHLVPDPVVVLFNRAQLDDLLQFCASSNRVSALGIDVKTHGSESAAK